MKHEDEVRLVLAQKIVAKARRKVRQITCDHYHCDCRDNINKTIDTLAKFGKDVFNCRPEYYMAIILLGDATREMVDEEKKTRSNEVIHL